MRCNQCGNEMKEGVIDTQFGWYYREQIKGKIVFPTCEAVFSGVQTEGYGLGYKMFAAYRCMACEIISIKIKNQ